MKRLQNYGLWVAVASFLGLVLQDLGINITPEKYQSYVDVILMILVLAGIISNPKDGKWFTDSDNHVK